MASPVLEFSVENSQIPIDLFVSKKHPNLPSGVLGFADAAGNIVYSVKNESSNSKPSSSAQTKRVLLDAAGIPVVSIYSHHGGCWRGFKRDGGDEESLLFRVQRTQNTWKRTEFEIFLVDENGGIQYLISEWQVVPFRNHVPSIEAMIYWHRQVLCTSFTRYTSKGVDFD